MKLESARFDKHEALKTVTVSMTVDELAFLYQMVAQFSPNEIVQASGRPALSEVLEELAGGAGNIMNVFFEDGANDVIRPFILRGGRQ